LLKEHGFSLQGTAKTLEGDQHPDRDAQFRYINEQVKEHQAAGEPVISVDAKKKEQLGQLPMAGQEWRPAGKPIEVEDYSSFAADTGLTVTVSHFPPGTSNWNTIEHRLFSHITMNWRGRPLTSHEVVLNTIAATTTRTGLRVEAALDHGSYPTGIAVSRDQLL